MPLFSFLENHDGYGECHETKILMGKIVAMHVHFEY